MATLIRQFLKIIAVSIFVVVFLFACSNGDGGSSSSVDASPELLASSESRELVPVNAESESNQFVADNTTFAINLYHAISDEAENLFFSPYSISVAMAMS